MIITFVAVAAFIVASVLDARSTIEAMKYPGAYEMFPLYRWPMWKKGPFQLWMYVAVAVLIVVLGIWQERYIELFILAGVRLFFALYWNPRQMRKAVKK